MTAITPQQTHKRALRWFRKFAIDGMALHGLHAVEADDMMDLALQFQQIVDGENNMPMPKSALCRARSEQYGREADEYYREDPKAEERGRIPCVDCGARQDEHEPFSGPCSRTKCLKFKEKN